MTIILPLLAAFAALPSPTQAVATLLLLLAAALLGAAMPGAATRRRWRARRAWRLAARPLRAG